MSVSRPAAVIALAAGEGTRMKSGTPKVLHELCGRPMLGHVLASARALDPQRLLVVVGHGRETVDAYLAEHEPTAETVLQEQQNGTGHAVRTALEAAGELDGTVVVTPGDTPLLCTATLADLAALHARDGNAVTVLSAEVDDADGYGRVLRDDDGRVLEIVEHKDATPEQRVVREINSAVYAFDGVLLADAVKRVSTANAQGEEYLTDVLGLLRADGHRVGVARTTDADEIQGVNDRVQLAQARRLLNARTVTALMYAGVTVVDPATIWVDAGVTAEPDAVVHPGTQLHGRTHLAAGAVVGPNCTLTDTTVGAGATVTNAVCEGAEVGAGATVGPYTFLRKGTRLGSGAKAGGFVEMKSAEVGEGSKVPHLSYVGDAEIGAGVNIGAATIFVNYDGMEKHRTTVGDHAFVGCDSLLVSPVHVGDGAYTAAGSVITGDVPPGAMGVARGRQRNIEGWVERRRPGTPAAEVAARAQRPGGPENDPNEQGEESK